MAEESETPFSFNPSEKIVNTEEKENESFFNKNKKIILIVVGGLLLVGIVVLILILVLRGKGEPSQSSEGEIKRSNNYLLGKYEIPSDSLEVTLYKTSSPLTPTVNYTENILSVVIDDTKAITTNDGKYKFDKKGNYNIYIYFKE